MKGVATGEGYGVRAKGAGLGAGDSGMGDPRGAYAGYGVRAKCAAFCVRAICRRGNEGYRGREKRESGALCPDSCLPAAGRSEHEA